MRERGVSGEVVRVEVRECGGVVGGWGESEWEEERPCTMQ
jgi:hypothetical protein